MSDNLYKATFWSIVQRYLPAIIQIIAQLLITRMICPSEYGEIAIVMTFYQIAILIIASGLGEGIMFFSKVSPALLSSVFYFNLMISVVLYLLLYFSSDVIAEYYAIDRISVLCKIIGINIICYGLSYVQKTLLQKELRFNILAYTSIFSALCGSTLGLYMAYHDYGIWSLVCLTLCINCTETVLLWIISSWKPTATFSFFQLKKILGYSLRLLSNNIVQVVYDNVFSLVIGKRLGSVPLGYYNRMQTVAYFTTTNFLYAVESAFFPVLCGNKDNHSAVFSAFQKLLSLTFLLNSIVLVSLIVLAKPIVIFVLTDKWSGGIEILQLVCIAFLFMPISYIVNSFLKIGNQTKVLLYGNAIKKSLGLLILIITVTSGNLKTICLGLIVSWLLDAVISMFLANRFLSYPIKDQLTCLKNSVLSAIVIGFLSYNIISVFDSNVLKISLGTSLIILLYFVIGRFFKTSEYDLITVIIKSKLKK